MHSSGLQLIGAVRGAVNALEVFLESEAWKLADSELREAARDVARAGSALDAARLAVVREVDSRLNGGSASEGVVRETTGASPAVARRDVAAARATGPEGPLNGFGRRLADGSVTREHVDVAVRCLDSIPRDVLELPHAKAVVVDFLAEAVDAGASARELRRAADELVARLDPDRADRFDPSSDQRRFLDFHTDGTGMLVGRFQLDPAAAAALRAAIDTCSAPSPDQVAEDGTVVSDPRTARQRRADALTTIAETALGVATPRRGERPRVVVHATPAQLAHVVGSGAAVSETGDVLSWGTLDRLSCDAVLQRVVVADSAGPLDVGRDQRLVTVSQRRALEARDGGCVICGIPPGWCDAHHIVPWAVGGPTDLANLVLLCPAHHTAVHTGAWVVEQDPGGAAGIVLVPPRWVDPARTPRAPVRHRLDALLRALHPGSVPTPTTPTTPTTSD
jgi:hypothetical protein